MREATIGVLRRCAAIALVLGVLLATLGSALPGAAIQTGLGAQQTGETRFGPARAVSRAATGEGASLAADPARVSNDDEASDGDDPLLRAIEELAGGPADAGSGSPDVLATPRAASMTDAALTPSLQRGLLLLIMGALILSLRLL